MVVHVEAVPCILGCQKSKAVFCVTGLAVPAVLGIISATRV
jgi:hypothetical protein